MGKLLSEIVAAKAALIAAMQANADAKTLNTIGAQMDALEAAGKPQRPNLLGAALWYVNQGIPTFPLMPKEKRPHPGTRGFKDATTDPERIREWWHRWPESNIGLATGHLFDVVDIDGAAGQVTRARHRDVFEPIEAQLVGQVSTPSPGGMHLYIPAQGDGNSQGILPCIDYRGIGGYVVAPPSVTEAGEYEWIGKPDFTALAESGVAL